MCYSRVFMFIASKELVWLDGHGWAWTTLATRVLPRRRATTTRKKQSKYTTSCIRQRLSCCKIWRWCPVVSLGSDLGHACGRFLARFCSTLFLNVEKKIIALISLSKQSLFFWTASFCLRRKVAITRCTVIPFYWLKVVVLCLIE